MQVIYTQSFNPSSTNPINQSIFALCPTRMFLGFGPIVSFWKIYMWVHHEYLSLLIATCPCPDCPRPMLILCLCHTSPELPTSQSASCHQVPSLHGGTTEKRQGLTAWSTSISLPRYQSNQAHRSPSEPIGAHWSPSEPIWAYHLLSVIAYRGHSIANLHTLWGNNWQQCPEMLKHKGAAEYCWPVFECYLPGLSAWGGVEIQCLHFWSQLSTITTCIQSLHRTSFLQLEKKTATTKNIGKTWSNARGRFEHIEERWVKTSSFCHSPLSLPVSSAAAS